MPTHSTVPAVASLVDSLASQAKGVVMTMGKGGVGKTTLTAHLATRLAGKGFQATLTTTDPAAHVEQAVGLRPPTLRVTRIDPELVVQEYRAAVTATAGQALDPDGRMMLEEDLRSPRTEEIAIFRAFAETVAQGQDEFVVIDTAPRAWARPTQCRTVSHVTATPPANKSSTSRTLRLNRL